jgi:two-component system nitrogen regulation response regulator GlnG
MPTARIVRVNAHSAIPAPVRCFVSTSADLRARIPVGMFRDSLHTDSAELITLPPLRERAQDIPALARHYLTQCCAHIAPEPPELSREAEACFACIAGPGTCASCVRS